MKNLILTLTILFSISYGAWSQDARPMNCFEQWKEVFKKRGAYTVVDDMHRKVIVSFIEGGDAYCYYGKVRVENGKITSIFVRYEDDTYQLFDKEFSNEERKAPGISNGISEKIVTEDKEALYVIFIESIKPKKKKYQQAPGPGELLK